MLAEANIEWDEKSTVNFEEDEDIDLSEAQGVLANLNVVWRPISNSSQAFAIDSRCSHTMYEGARGPGKTITQLMKFRRRVGLGYGSYWRGVIFDLEFDNLSGLVAESKKWFPKFFDGAKFLASASAYKWVWPTGEELLFRHVKKLADYEGFHGHEYPFIGWNELTKYPTSELYDKMMSVNRSSFMPERDTPMDKDGNYLTPDGKPLPPIPLEVFSTTNPNGPGHNWVKKRFILCGPRGKIIKTEVEVFNPQTQANDIVIKTQVTIFGSYRENIYLPAAYIAELESITDENLRKAWLWGDWDSVTGGAFDDIWNANIHVVPRFIVPKGWRIDRTFDWGSTAPFSVGWWAEANGEEAIVEIGGKQFRFCPAPGSLIQLYEWYGTPKDKNGQLMIGTNKGLKMSAQAIAEGIRDREISLLANGWITSQPWAGPADNQIRNVTEIDVDTIENKMKKVGISWLESDKSQGSRKMGLQIIRDRLTASGLGEGPGLYFMQNCVASIEILPTLPRDPEDLDDILKTAEAHTYDMTRYRMTKGLKVTPKKQPTLNYAR